MEIKMSSLEYGKITARIDRDLYEFVQARFHYGQQKKLFDSIFLSLKELIETERFEEVLNYMYHEKELILPKIIIGDINEINQTVS